MSYILINYIGKKGGGALYSYEMSKGLVSNGEEIIAVIPDNIENISEWEQLEKCKLIKIKGYSDNYISFAYSILRFYLFEKQKIKKECKNKVLKCIYIPMIQPMTNLVNSIFKGTKIITTIHDPIQHKGTSRIIEKLCDRAINKSDKIILLSKVFKPYVIEHYKKSSENIYVIPHGIFDNYKRVYDPAKQYKFDKSKVNFLFFGRITPYKGLDILAKAFEKLLTDYDNIALTIVGNGDFSPYQSLYDNLKNITIINRWINDDEVYGFFKETGVITVLPYTEATQSGVVAVAMACESLVICSKTGGLTEQIQDLATGIFVEPNNVDSLYTEMKKIVTNGVDDKIVKNAKKYIEDLSWDKLAAQLICTFY